MFLLIKNVSTLFGIWCNELNCRKICFIFRHISGYQGKMSCCSVRSNKEIWQRRYFCPFVLSVSEKYLASQKKCLA